MNYIYLIADTQDRCLKIGTGPSQSHFLNFPEIQVLGGRAEERIASRGASDPPSKLQPA
jgi:hypothetical protein